MRARAKWARWAGPWAMLAALLLGACEGEGATPPSSDGGTIQVPVGVETFAPTSVRAGQMLAVSCLLVDAAGETFVAPDDAMSSLRFVPADSAERGPDGEWIATRAGALEVACTFASLGLTDDTPAVIEVLPGDAARVLTHLEPDSVVAGGTAEASCEVFDAWGNAIAGATPAVRAEPAREGNAFEGTTGTLTRAGRYDVYCTLAGAESRGAALEVTPALPASIVISRVPEQPVYGIGQVIEIARLVSDRFGNVVSDARTPVTSEAAGEQLGEARFRYLRDGRYTLTATVQPPTEQGAVLTASTEVVVDGSGPAIGCDDPVDGGILDRAPGGAIEFRGTVSDLTGVTALRVNGESIAIEADGSFRAPLTTHYGINFVDLAAVDGNGREASRACAFLTADTWAPDDRTLGETLSLRLGQEAFDDGDRGDGLDSLADVLHTVLNSRGLRDTLHNSLLAANPLKPSACDQGGPFGICVLRSEIIYRDLDVRGPNTASLTLVDGGLRANVHIENLRVNVRVHGRALGIGFDTAGWVTFHSSDVQVTFDTGLDAGRPRVTVRPGSVSVNMGRISTDFSGISGAVIDVVARLFNGRVRDMVAGVLRDWVTNNFDSVLDGLLGGLDVSSLGASFDVSRLGGGDPIRLAFGIGLSSLGTDASRMLFGIGTRIFASAAHARPTLGAPVRSGPRLDDAGGPSATAVSLHEVVLTQAMHALWRAGFFDPTLSGQSIGGLPAGVRATLTTGLPPVVVLRDDGRVELSLGAMNLDLVYPELFTEPVSVTLGARASMAVTLAGEDLSFSDFRIEELYFSTGLTSLDSDTRDTLERFLSRLLGRVISSALEGALPSIPIPSFGLPASLASFGLPAGAELGLVSPSLSSQPPHFVLRGGFSVR